MGIINRRRKMRISSSSSSSSTVAAAAILLAGSGIDGPVLSPAHALGAAFSCGSSWREARSCTTLCPTISTRSNNGEEGDSSVCPSGQKCYAGISCEPNQSMDWILDWQGRLERRDMDGRMSQTDKNRRKEVGNSFVCGTTYADAETRCTLAAAGAESLSSLSSSSSSDYNGLHYCSTGSSSECPSTMECYASVPCLPKQQQQLELHSENVQGEQGLSSPPLSSPSSNSLPIMDDIDFMMLVLSSNDTMVSNINTTEDQDATEEENTNTNWTFGSTFSWSAFFRESLLGLRMKSSSSLSSSSVVSSSHPSLRYSSRRDWN